MKVYWIKTKDMIDIFQQGYVGVTSLSLEKRLLQHKNNKARSVVSKALKKYSDCVIECVFEGTEEECLSQESRYRPSENVGWNIAKGGSVPTKMNAEKATKISVTLREKGVSPYSVNTHSPSAIEKRKQSMKDRKWFYNPQTGQNRRLLNQPDGWMPGKLHKIRSMG